MTVIGLLHPGEMGAAVAALLLAARALADAEGIDQDLLAEWELSQPALRSQWERASASVTAKGGAGTGRWRR